MNKLPIGAAMLLFLLLVCPAAAQEPAGDIAEKFTKTWTFSDSLRQVLIYAPKQAVTEPTPVVFVYHGRGGGIEGAEKTFAIHELWPEAIILYPQGLWFESQNALVRQGNGWRVAAEPGGGEDMLFFDTTLEFLKETYNVDENRIYATGQSNGGGFVYSLWNLRGDVFAALAPANAASHRLGELAWNNRKPKPLFIVGGEKDPLVLFEWYTPLIERVRELNGITEPGKKVSEYITRYDSPGGYTLATYLHPGGHALPKAAIPPIVEFFKKHTKK